MKNIFKRIAIAVSVFLFPVVVIAGLRPSKDQLSAQRAAEGIYANRYYSNAFPGVGLGMPKEWKFARQGVDQNIGSLYQGRGGFWQAGADYVWMKLVYKKEHLHNNKRYLSVVMLLKFLCAKKQFAVVEDYRYAKDGRLVSKKLYALKDQTYHPLEAPDKSSINKAMYVFSLFEDSIDLCMPYDSD